MGRIRILCAAVFFIGVCLLFLDASGFLPPRLAFLAKVQLVPAILTGSLVIVLGLLLLTFVFGRIYCSVVCPLGVFQDIVGYFGKKRRFRHTAGQTLVRGIALCGFGAAFLMGIPNFFGVLEPYSAFGRIATGLLNPVWSLGNNGLAALSERMGNYWVSTSEIWIKGWFTLGLSLLTFIVIGFLAYKHGRLWCNSLCPAGPRWGRFPGFLCFERELTKKNAAVAGCVRNRANRPVSIQKPKPSTRPDAYPASIALKRVRVIPSPIPCRPRCASRSKMAGKATRQDGTFWYRRHFSSYPLPPRLRRSRKDGSRIDSKGSI